MNIRKIILKIILLIPFLGLFLIIFLYNDIFTWFRATYSYSAISDMDYQKIYKPQSLDTFFKDGCGIRIPPKNTVPRNVKIYKYNQVEFEKAEKEFTNPLTADEFILARGKNRFETFCIYCHGEKGKGDGLVITKVQLKDNEEGFPKPPDFTAAQTKLKSDGRLFHILSSGQNLMFSYADKLSETDRWAVINYIRRMQGLR